MRTRSILPGSIFKHGRTYVSRCFFMTYYGMQACFHYTHLFISFCYELCLHHTPSWRKTIAFCACFYRTACEAERGTKTFAAGSADSGIAALPKRLMFFAIVVLGLSACDIFPPDSQVALLFSSNCQCGRRWAFADWFNRAVFRQAFQDIDLRTFVL